MRLLVIQHHEHHLGLIEELPFELKVHRSDLDPEVPALGNADALLVLGGPQTAFSDEGFPSRRRELKLIKSAIKADKPILGICLGAQLLSIAAGGNGYKRLEPEFGWHPVTLSAAGVADKLFEDCPPIFSPRHHHNDSFEMPPGAVRLASSEQCIEQGYRLGEHVWGLQFHFEMRLKNRNPIDHDETWVEGVENLEPIARKIFANFSSVVEKHSYNLV